MKTASKNSPETKRKINKLVNTFDSKIQLQLVTQHSASLQVIFAADTQELFMAKSKYFQRKNQTNKTGGAYVHS